MRLLGRTPPSLDYQVEEEHAEKGVEEEEHAEKDEKEVPKSTVELSDRSSKGVYYSDDTLCDIYQTQQIDLQNLEFTPQCYEKVLRAFFFGFSFFSFFETWNKYVMIIVITSSTRIVFICSSHYLLMICGV